MTFGGKVLGAARGVDMHRWLALGMLVGGAACGHTIPDPKGQPSADDTGTPIVGHAPELVGFQIDFETATGRSMLVAQARLGDIDDNLVPEGTVNARLLDADGAERMVLEGVVIGSPPTELPEPTMLRVPFEIASDPGEAWEVRVQVFDRGGLGSTLEKAVWSPVGSDSGG